MLLLYLKQFITSRVYFWFGASFLRGAGQSAGDGRNATGQMDMGLARPRQIAPNVKGTHDTESY